MGLTGLTDVACRDFNHVIRIIGEDHGMCLRVNWRPPGEEDGVLEHEFGSLPSRASLLQKEQSGGHGGPLGIPDNAFKRSSLLYDLDEILERVVGAPVGGRDAFPHQLAHRVLGRLAVGEVPDPSQDVVFLCILHILIRLHEAEVWRLPKVLLETLGRHRLARPVDEVEGRRAILCQLFHDRG